MPQNISFIPDEELDRLLSSKENRTQTSLSKPGCQHSDVIKAFCTTTEESLYLASVWVQGWFWIPVVPLKPLWEGAQCTSNGAY